MEKIKPSKLAALQAAIEDTTNPLSFEARQAAIEHSKKLKAQQYVELNNFTTGTSS